jgi:Rrf2 family protein
VINLASSTRLRRCPTAGLLFSDSGPANLSNPVCSCGEQNTAVRISAKADYAVRAAIFLADESSSGPLKAEAIARSQEIPLKFLLNILSDLKRGRIVTSHRGTQGGFQLARPASEITVADVIRAVEGPLASVHEILPEDVHYPAPSESLQQVWIAVRASLRSVLEAVTIADLRSGSLPESILTLNANPEAWTVRQ